MENERISLDEQREMNICKICAIVEKKPTRKEEIINNLTSEKIIGVINPVSIAQESVDIAKERGIITESNGYCKLPYNGLTCGRIL